MNAPATDPDAQRQALLALYDASVHQVYAYLHRRCGSSALAEDLTAETFTAAIDAVRRGRAPELTEAWLVTVARNKLVDHWRRHEREQRALTALDGAGAQGDADSWDAVLDAGIAHDVLRSLGAHHQAALTLRYLDALPVRDVAAHLGRSVGATEVLLVRARRSFRAEYERQTGEAGR